MMEKIQVLTDEQIKKLDEMEGLTPSTVTLNKQLDLFPELNMNYSHVSDTSSIDMSDFTLDIGNIDLSVFTSTSASSIWNSSSISLDDIIISGNPSDRSMTVSGNVNVNDGDININGISLSDRLDKMEERLGILRPHPELEKDFENLKKLGERYRKLEKKISEQMKTYDILKEDNSDV